MKGPVVQYIESSVIGIRSAVITLKRLPTPLRFVIFPMVHVGEPEFYRRVADMARQCDLIVAEGAPSRVAPVQQWMAGLRWDHLVDQLTALDLESLGVPVIWEFPQVDNAKSRRELARDRAVDTAAAIALRALGRYGSSLGLPSLDQSDEHDDKWEQLLDSGRFGRFLRSNIVDARDARLVLTLEGIHRERCNEPGRIAVVFGAGHVPAVVDYLTEKLQYYVGEASWLTVANAPD